jgi:L-alanine-DL-glutamate epimerase-like enolase superfamily enzyme
MSHFSTNWTVKELKLRQIFTIARGSKASVKNVFLTLKKDGIKGVGEAGPNTRYEETAETVICFFEHFPFKGLDKISSLEEVERFIDKASSEVAKKKKISIPQSAKTAIEMAWLDWWAKSNNQTLWKLWGAQSNIGPVSSYTIGLDEIPVMQKKILEAEKYPLYKIKLGTEKDREIIRGIREVTDKPLRVDANEGWETVDQALKEIEFLRSQNVELVEQPMHASMKRELKELKKYSGLPLCADESFTGREDLNEIVACFDIINIKLMKIGSLVKAKRTIEHAHDLGLKVMIGCMIESSVAITAGGILSLFSEYADLDGNLLISNDPYTGLNLNDKGEVVLPYAKGLGSCILDIEGT